MKDLYGKVMNGEVVQDWYRGFKFYPNKESAGKKHRSKYGVVLCAIAAYSITVIGIILIIFL